MSRVNIVRAIEASRTKSTVYTPLFEAIVNALDAIKESGRTDGEVELVFYREQTELALLDQGSGPTARITGIDIIDNGVGFTDDNVESFDELHSAMKAKKGGKGYGRVFYKQYFRDVDVESLYRDEFYDDELMFRRFTFTQTEFTDDMILAPVDDEDVDVYTKVSLRNMHSMERGKFDIRLQTISRRLLEHLLVYFVDDNYACPRITLRDESTGEVEVLNDYFLNTEQIVEVGRESFNVGSDLTGDKYDFLVKVFKIFFSKSKSSVYLTAHQREVTKTSMHEYRDEFKSDFYEIVERKKGKPIEKNYIVAAYVSGPFLDSNVSGERGEFLVKADMSISAPLTLNAIESAATDVAAKFFSVDVEERQGKKSRAIEDYVANDAPWLREYVELLDAKSVHYDASPEEINTALERVKFEKTQEAKKEIRHLIDAPPDNPAHLQIAVDKISEKVGQVGKSDLVQHVVLRKAVIDLFAQALQWDKDGKYQKEDAVHGMIFPLKGTSDTVAYDDHNLWMVDERLSFHEYAASDLSVVDGANKDRPDIVIFDNPILVRDSESLSNPVTVIEFKRPMRNNFKKDELDPFKQVAKYVDIIRSGNYIGKNGRTVLANKDTPAYGYVIADLTPKVREFCRDHQMVEDPDGQGYHGFHSTWRIYFEVISFDKLLTNAEQRNKILFNKLGII